MIFVAGYVSRATALVLTLQTKLVSSMDDLAPLAPGAGGDGGRPKLGQELLHNVGLMVGLAETEIQVRRAFSLMLRLLFDFVCCIRVVRRLSARCSYGSHSYRFLFFCFNPAVVAAATTAPVFQLVVYRVCLFMPIGSRADCLSASPVSLLPRYPSPPHSMFTRSSAPLRRCTEEDRWRRTGPRRSRRTPQT